MNAVPRSVQQLLAIASLVVTVLLGVPGQASAEEECTSCWVPRCGDELRSYLPPCAKKSGTPRKNDKQPPAAATPAPAPGTCPSGQSISPDTEGHCCWSGQAWNGQKCVGVPTECPAGFEVNVTGQTCEPPVCTPGTVRTKDGMHCCWQGQAWSNGAGQCIGIPTVCPVGFAVSIQDQTCAQAECPTGTERVDGNGPCCFPGQTFKTEKNMCVGEPTSCMDGMTLDKKHDRCELASCTAGHTRASDGIHCCYPGQDWNGAQCAGTPSSCPDGLEPDAGNQTCSPSQCAPGTERADDNTHCCFPGQTWNKQKKQCQGVPSRCMDGFELDRKKKSCELLACVDGRTRTSDGVHCCWHGQRFDASKAACLGVPVACPAGQKIDARAELCTSGLTLAEQEAQAREEARRAEDARRKEDARQREEARRADEAKRKEDARLKEEARLKAEAAKKTPPPPPQPSPPPPSTTTVVTPPPEPAPQPPPPTTTQPTTPAPTTTQPAPPATVTQPPPVTQAPTPVVEPEGVSPARALLRTGATTLIGFALAAVPVAALCVLVAFASYTTGALLPDAWFAGALGMGTYAALVPLPLLGLGFVISVPLALVLIGVDLVVVGE